jgi:hypothetical protein
MGPEGYFGDGFDTAVKRQHVVEAAVILGISRAVAIGQVMHDHGVRFVAQTAAGVFTDGGISISAFIVAAGNIEINEVITAAVVE